VFLQAIHTYLGEENIKSLVNFVLHYIADLDIPIKRYVLSTYLRVTLIFFSHRGTFIEFRSGMLNVSPIGRNCSREERNAYEKFDLVSYKLTVAYIFSK
jgi:phosphomannomutase